MKHPRILLFAEDLPAPVLAELEGGAHAAWLVDVERGRFAAANREGAALLGLAPVRAMPGPDAGTPLLDAAMPALARLRALAAEADAGAQDKAGAPEPLVFWTPGGAVRLLARVRLVRSGGRTLAVVASEAGTRPGRPAAERGPPPPAPFTGDDAAKLKEIARRIREGRTALAERRRAERAARLPVPPRRDEPPPGDAPAAPPALRAGLAHELKTPLSAIAAAAEIMKEQRFGPLGTPRYVGYAADIHASAEHVLGVIDRMLAEAGSAGGGAVPGPAAASGLDFAEIDAGGVLESVLSQVTPLAERAGITLALDLAPGLPHLVADLTSLRQIVFNLLTNALKFTAAGGKVTVAARYSLDGPLCIAVSDTGSGMSRREIARLLGPPAPTPRTERTGRTGLGLGVPLVRALAAANGAELLIESEPGKGTSATVVFARDRVIPV